jgi:hypothetical protein
MGYYGGPGEKDWVLERGWGLGGEGGNAILLYLQYGSKYTKHYVII